jgi:hypothetical protein
VLASLKHPWHLIIDSLFANKQQDDVLSLGLIKHLLQYAPDEEEVKKIRSVNFLCKLKF